MLFPSQFVLDAGNPPDIIENINIHYPPYRFEGLTVNGEKFDLRDPSSVQEGLNQVKEYRKLLNSNQLDTYDNKSTEMFGGGKSNLRYDEIRLQIAEDYHKGKHFLSFDEQHQEAKRIQEYEQVKWKKQ